MASGLQPLCPSCLDRVAGWNAAACPSCQKSSDVTQCDYCQKTRAGAFLPDAGKDGGAQRFVCGDCMHALLDEQNSERLRDTVLAVMMLAVLVYRFPTAHPGFGYAIGAAALVCAFLWWKAAGQLRRPKARAGAVMAYFGKQVERAMKKRPGQRR